MKTFHYHHQIGKSKHVVSFHDGVKKHNDGSRFFDIQICKNKKNLKKFINGLLKDGYVEKSFNSQ